MDDFLILDTDKERLKKNWKLINEEISKLKLVTNKKSNIYRVSKGFLFLGYKYKISNNKLNVSCSKETFYRIRKKLDRLYQKDKVKYNLTLASYKGYIMRGSTLEKKNFKMKITEIYKSYKDKYPDSVILIKDKAFYKSFYDDAKVLWNIFKYRVINKGVSIGNITYDKTIDRLNKMNISFVVISNNSEVLSSIGDKDVYREYMKESVENYDNFIKKKELIERIEKLLDNKEDSYEEISSFLDRYENKASICC